MMLQPYYGILFSNKKKGAIDAHKLNEYPDN